MRKENIFDLYNEQHKNDVIEAEQELPGIVRAEDVSPEVIPGEQRAAAAQSSNAATIPNIEPAGPVGPAAGAVGTEVEIDPESEVEDNV